MLSISTKPRLSLTHKGRAVVLESLFELGEAFLAAVDVIVILFIQLLIQVTTCLGEASKIPLPYKIDLGIQLVLADLDQTSSMLAGRLGLLPLVREAGIGILICKFDLCLGLGPLEVEKGVCFSLCLTLRDSDLLIGSSLEDVQLLLSLAFPRLRHLVKGLLLLLTCRSDLLREIGALLIENTSVGFGGGFGSVSRYSLGVSGGRQLIYLTLETVCCLSILLYSIRHLTCCPCDIAQEVAECIHLLYFGKTRLLQTFMVFYVLLIQSQLLES